MCAPSWCAHSVLLHLVGAADHASCPHVSCLMTATTGLQQAASQDQTSAAGEPELPAVCLHLYVVRKTAGLHQHLSVAAAL